MRLVALSNFTTFVFICCFGTIVVLPNPIENLSSGWWVELLIERNNACLLRLPLDLAPRNPINIVEIHTSMTTKVSTMQRGREYTVSSHYLSSNLHRPTTCALTHLAESPDGNALWEQIRLLEQTTSIYSLREVEREYIISSLYIVLNIWYPISHSCVSHTLSSSAFITLAWPSIYSCFDCSSD